MDIGVFSLRSDTLLMGGSQAARLTRTLLGGPGLQVATRRIQDGHRLSGAVSLASLS